MISGAIEGSVCWIDVHFTFLMDSGTNCKVVMIWH